MKKPETLAAQALGWIDEKTRAVAPPLHASSTFLRARHQRTRAES